MSTMQSGLKGTNLIEYCENNVVNMIDNNGKIPHFGRKIFRIFIYNYNCNCFYNNMLFIWCFKKIYKKEKWILKNYFMDLKGGNYKKVELLK